MNRINTDQMQLWRTSELLRKSC